MPFNNPVSEKIETILYSPGLQDTTDLELATKTITAITEASGTGNADYSKALTIPSPTDARLVVLRIAARLAVTIDSMTAGTLHCRVYVDVQDANHLLFDASWTSSGAKLAAVDTFSTSLATIFGLFSNGAAHTFYFFFWVDTGNAVISLVQAWGTVGSCSTGSVYEFLKIIHSGFYALGGLYANKIGVGTPSIFVYDPTLGAAIFPLASTTNNYLNMTKNGLSMRGYGTVASDINYIPALIITLRSVS